ncbi:HNH endonuclease [Streptomyces sp. NPDC094437]|uniref:HNH endonuclease n=1 Tax=Streptomyces sp. NPDC094437 TaxID=3366060 RepID=UPI0038033818
MKRTVLSSKQRRALRARVFDRDGQQCFYCRTPFASDTDATLDHYIPYRLWRTWRASNLVLSCVGCNERKADALPSPLVWVLLANSRTATGVMA